MNDLRFGFIGCGRHARTCLYPSLAALGIRLQSVCARHLEHAQEIAEKYEIPYVYDNYKIMLREQYLDAVFIAVSGEQHTQIVLDCLKAHAHVFVEKPVGLTVEAAVRVARMAKKTGRHVQVGYMKRFSPVYQKARLMMNNQKTFGTPVSFDGLFSYGFFWICYNRMKFFLNAVIHNLDLLRYFVGEITDIRCLKKLTMEGISYQFNFTSDQRITGSVIFKGLFPWIRPKEEIKITGTKSSVVIPENNTVLTWQAGYIGELKEFAESVKNNKPTQNTAEENIKTMELYEKILFSLEKK